MSDHHWNLQKAVHGALTAASVAGGRVYDDVPADPIFPYVQIGAALPIVDGVLPGDDGIAEILTLHVWSRHRGQKEVKQIASAIYDTLHQTALTVTGRASAIAWLRRLGPIMLDPDGLTRHGVVEVEIVHRS